MTEKASGESYSTAAKKLQNDEERSEEGYPNGQGNCISEESSAHDEEQIRAELGRKEKIERERRATGECYSALDAWSGFGKRLEASRTRRVSVQERVWEKRSGITEFVCDLIAWQFDKFGSCLVEVGKNFVKTF